MKKMKLSGAAALLLILLVGCVSPYSQMMGPYYLKQREYKQGVEAFKEQLEANPKDASAAFYIGRYYLAMKQPEDGLPYMQKAVDLVPDDADYRFWLGVNYWAVVEYAKEKAAYEKALSLDPDHISANLYLGHGFTDDEDWAMALRQYDMVIALDRYNPEALYYRGVALEGLGRDKEAVAALKKFLKYYPDGSLAMRAATRLNLLGDFTYRNYIIGKRNVTLRTMTFKPGTNDLLLESKESLHVIAAMMGENDKLDLHIVVFKDGDAAAAKARAHNVRDYILAGRPEFDPKRLPLSWFGTAEDYEREGKTCRVKDSVLFVTVTE